jgi:cytochrome c-type biogenesis protein CcmF
MVVLGIGVIGSTAFQSTTMKTLDPGQRLELDGFELQHNGLYEARADDGRTMVIARATVYKDGKIVDHIRPRRDIFYTMDNATGQLTPSTNMSIPGMYSTLASDFYAIITHWDGNRVTFRAYHNPLIGFVWMGGIILILGTLVALWPSRRPAHAVQTVPVPAARGIPAGGD